MRAVPRPRYVGAVLPAAVAALVAALAASVSSQPPKTFKQGETYQIPVSAPHLGKTGPGGVKLMATFVLEKDKPFATPAP